MIPLDIGYLLAGYHYTIDIIVSNGWGPGSYYIIEIANLQTLKNMREVCRGFRISLRYVLNITGCNFGRQWYMSVFWSNIRFVLPSRRKVRRWQRALKYRRVPAWVKQARLPTTEFTRYFQKFRTNFGLANSPRSGAFYSNLQHFHLPISENIIIMLLKSYMLEYILKCCRRVATFSLSNKFSSNMCNNILHYTVTNRIFDSQRIEYNPQTSIKHAAGFNKVQCVDLQIPRIKNWRGLMNYDSFGDGIYYYPDVLFV